MAIAELEFFTIGMIFDLFDAYIEDQNDIRTENVNIQKVKKATQKDFDKF